VRVSTRKTTYEHAARVASDLYDEARYRERFGLAPVQKSYADIARITIDDLKRDLEAGTRNQCAYVGVALPQIHRNLLGKSWYDDVYYFYDICFNWDK
jgi:hypothetical protein